MTTVPPDQAPAAALARSFAPFGGQAAAPNVSITAPAEGTIPRSYTLPKGKLQALIGLMERQDVPIFIERHTDHIVVHATQEQHEAFAAFMKLIHPEGGGSPAATPPAGRGGSGDPLGSVAAPAISAERSAEQYRRALDKFEKARDQVERRLEQSQRRSESVRERGDRLSEMSDEIDERAKAAAMDAERESLNAKTAELRAKAAASHAEADAMDAEVEALESQLEALSATFEALDSQISELEESNESATDETETVGEIDVDPMLAESTDIGDQAGPEVEVEAAEQAEPAEAVEIVEPAVPASGACAGT